MMKAKLGIALVITAVLTTLSFQTAHAQQAASVEESFRWQAKIEEIKLFKDQGTPFLTWKKDTILIESEGMLHYTDIQGSFREKIVQATLNSKPMPVRDDGTFDIHFGFPGQAKTFTITAVDTKNKVYRMQYKIVPIDHQEVVVEKNNPHRWRFSAGAGITRLSYRQQNVSPFDQYAVTVKGSATYRLVPEKFDLGISTFYNLVPFGTTSAAGYKLQYLGVNARVGYNLVGAPSKFRVNLNGGLYFNTSFSTIGFANMYGPQLYPEFIYIFENGNSLLFYGKYSPALSQSMKISFNDNREVAMGMHYSFPISFSNRMSVGVDLSQLSLSVPGDWASTNTYSLSAGISF